MSRHCLEFKAMPFKRYCCFVLPTRNETELRKYILALFVETFFIPLKFTKFPHKFHKNSHLSENLLQFLFLNS